MQVNLNKIYLKLYQNIFQVHLRYIRMVNIFLMLKSRVIPFVQTQTVPGRWKAVMWSDMQRRDAGSRSQSVAVANPVRNTNRNWHTLGQGIETSGRSSVKRIVYPIIWPYMPIAKYPVPGPTHKVSGENL
jgi:hypothetical protein